MGFLFFFKSYTAFTTSSLLARQKQLQHLTSLAVHARATALVDGVAPFLQDVVDQKSAHPGQHEGDVEGGLVAACALSRRAFAARPRGPLLSYASLQRCPLPLHARVAGGQREVPHARVRAASRPPQVPVRLAAVQQQPIAIGRRLLTMSTSTTAYCFRFCFCCRSPTCAGRTSTKLLSGGRSGPRPARRTP